MKTLLTVSAVIEFGAGLVLMSAPSPIAIILIGAPLDAPAALVMARVAGAAVLSLGLACWLAREDAQSRAARGLTVAMLLYNIAVVAILASAGLGLAMHGQALWPGVALHVAMTIWCIAALTKSPANSMTIHSDL